MQPPRVSLFKRPLLWLGAALTMTVIVVLMRHPAPHSISYVRYVSPPRLDGTRCTFLFPSGFEMPLNSGAVYVHATGGKHYQIQSVQIRSRRISRGEIFVKRFALFRQAFPVNCADISVTSIDDPAQPDPFPTRPIQSDNPRYLKSESNSIGEDGGEHDIILKDKLSHVKYDFEYICWLPNTADSSGSKFTIADAVISKSFQVLPPGAALPVGTPKP